VQKGSNKQAIEFEATMELLYFLGILFDFLSRNLIAILSLLMSSMSLTFYILDYRHKTRGKIEVEVSESWDFELEEKTLDDGAVSATVKMSGGYKPISLENVGGSGTTLKSMKIVKKRWIRIGSSAEAKLAWRKEFYLTQLDEKGNPVRLSIWSKVEPGQSVNLLIPHITLLDVMLDNNMLNLNNKYQGRFSLLIEHVFGKGKSRIFTVNLSENLRRFILERQKEFGHIICMDVPGNE